MTRTPRWGAGWGLVALSLLVACGARPASAPLATDGSTSTAVAPTEVLPTDAVAATSAATADRHPGHDALAAALPTADQLSWMPSTAQPSDDNDLTSRLSIPDCAGQSAHLPSREASATNRVFDVACQQFA